MVFYPQSSENFDIAECKWVNRGHRPKTILTDNALDHVPVDRCHKDCQVIKDKDLALHNTTVTDIIVSSGLKIVHINCVAHAHMFEKCDTGNLVYKEDLVCCLSWLKKIDEGNKVVFLLSECGQHKLSVQMCHCVVPALCSGAHVMMH
jgi:hypothetical protein